MWIALYYVFVVPTAIACVLALLDMIVGEDSYDARR